METKPVFADKLVLKEPRQTPLPQVPSALGESRKPRSPQSVCFVPWAPPHINEVARLAPTHITAVSRHGARRPAGSSMLCQLEASFLSSPQPALLSLSGSRGVGWGPQKVKKYNPCVPPPRPSDERVALSLPSSTLHGAWPPPSVPV